MNEKEKEYFEKMYNFLKKILDIDGRNENNLDEIADEVDTIKEEIKVYLLLNGKEIEKCLD